MPRVEPRMQVVLDAIARARVADKRMRLTESLGDDVGLQMAYQAVLFNLQVITDALAELPAHQHEHDLAIAPVLDGPFVVDAERIHRVVDVDLDELESAVHRLSRS